MGRVLPLLASLVFMAPGEFVTQTDADTTIEAHATVAESAFPGDFDFLIGEWQVLSRRLKLRLAGNDEWLEFPSTCRFWKILDGMVVQDECVTVRNGEMHTGGSYRIYNPTTGRWTVYWASTAVPELGLISQVEGAMRDGAGDLFGEELFEGEMVRLRFRWRRISNTEAYWEQAYFDERNGSWETNWTMRFTR